MTAGALIQIVTSYAPQDIYLSMNPEMTFFKSIYKRHSNFAMETVPIEFTDNPDFGKRNRIRINRYGDLISKLYLHIKIDGLNRDYVEALRRAEGIDHNANIISCYCIECIEDEYRDKVNYGWINSLGHALIESVHIEIGGTRIDRHYGEWLEIWSELTTLPSKRAAYYELIGKVDPRTWTADTFIGDVDLFVPLQFWFCKEYGLALPLIALQYHDVDLIFNFRKFEDCWVAIKPNVILPEKPDFYANLLVEYIFVDLDERRELISKSHIYLIEQLQTCNNNELSGKHNNIDFYLNHPVKEILWTFQRNDIATTKDWFNYSPYLDRTNHAIRDIFDTAHIQINGSDRQRKLPAKYYRILTKYNTHSVIPDNYIYSYSFSLNPENNKPSGSINFSHIDNARLVINMRHKIRVPYKLMIYGINYNILLITSGMGSTLFYS